MDSIVDTFLEKYSLAADPGAKESMIDTINSCFKVYAEYMSKDLLADKKVNKAAKEPKPKDEKPAKAAKTPKAERKVLENPAEATSMDALNGCTIQILAKWCKDHEMKVGGKKEEVVARVWRHLQGETSDEDKTPKARPRKKSAESAAPHPCCGVTKAGKPCVLAGTSCVDGKWLCFRHNPDLSKETAAEKKAIDSLESLEAKSNESSDSSGSESDSSGSSESDSSGSSESEEDCGDCTGKFFENCDSAPATASSSATPVKAKGKGKAPAKAKAPVTKPKTTPKKKVIELSEE